MVFRKTQTVIVGDAFRLNPAFRALTLTIASNDCGTRIGHANELSRPKSGTVIIQIRKPAKF